jgi:hypothetical protein
VSDDPALTPADELRRRVGARGWVLARIDGVSMEPTLFRGDTVRLESPESVQLGDIVTFELHGRLYTHRVARLAGDTVFCRGDNRTTGDPGVPRSQVVGRVTEVIGRGSLQPVHPNHPAIALRHALRRTRSRTHHLAAELQLLDWQTRGTMPASRGGLSSAGVPADAFGNKELVLGPDSIGAGSVTPTPGVDRIIVPAGIYSRLPRAERLDLVRGLSADRVSVAAFPRELMGRLPRQLGRLRKVAAAAGRQIGQDGDAMLPAGSVLTAGYVHYFGALELSEELRGALPTQIVSVKRVTSEWGPLLVGSVEPRPSGPRRPDSHST